MNQQNFRRWLTFIISCGSIALAGCNSIQTNTEPDTPDDPNDPIAAPLVVSVSLATPSLASGQQTQATATVTREGAAVANQEVCFKADTFGLIATSSCVNTDNAGTARAALVAATKSGTGTLSVTTGTMTATASYTVSAPQLTLTLSSNQVTNSSPATVTAVVTDGTGTPVANTIVNFSLGDNDFGTLSPESGSVLTDATGTATLTLSTGSASGADTLTAVADVVVRAAGSGQVLGTATVTDNATYQASVSTMPTNQISLTPLTLGTTSLSAYGTTSVSVSVLNNGTAYVTPVTVSFTSSCASRNKATLPASVSTINGVATVSYRDNGCGGTDLIQASVGINSVSPVTAQLNVAAPSIGSIQFVSASPTNISLRGTGGAGRQETSLVKFKIVDQAGQPVAADVNFALSTEIGGTKLSTTSAKSDATTGEVSTYVQAGTVSTPVRVTATVAGLALTTQSDQLTISTGLPDQAHFSVSATTLNIEGWDFDGTTTNLTARLADHFGNPVPDGTAVSFVAEGGAVGSNCLTVGGACSVTYTSQALRPSNGRVTVLAYAIGEETFTDINGDGVATLEAERIDANSQATDMGEAFVDSNESGSRDANEPFFDFNHNGAYDGPDGKLNSTLCQGTICGSSRTLHVRSLYSDNKPLTLILADSQARLANISLNGVASVSLPASLNLGGCTAKTYTLDFDVVSDYDTDSSDGLNPMPAGTTVSARVSENGKLVGKTSWTIGNALFATSHRFTVTSDASGSNCTVDSTKQGQLMIDITTPKNFTTTYIIDLVDET